MLWPLVPQTIESAEWWLSAFELALVPISAAVVAGLVLNLRSTRFRERERDRWIPMLPSRNRRWDWPVIWEGVVIVAILFELFADGGIWIASDALQKLSDKALAAERGKRYAAESNILQQLRPRDDISKETYGNIVKYFFEHRMGIGPLLIEYPSWNIDPETFEYARLIMTVLWAAKIPFVKREIPEDEYLAVDGKIDGFFPNFNRELWVFDRPNTTACQTFFGALLSQGEGGLVMPPRCAKLPSDKAFGPSIVIVLKRFPPFSLWVRRWDRKGPPPLGPPPWYPMP